MLHSERILEGRVVVWTLDEPRTKNALDAATIDALTQAARGAAGDPSLRAAILTGRNGIFASGGDLRELRDRDSAADAAELSDAGYAMTSAIAELPFPTIAALGGAAIGGGAELAVACDLRIAEAGARISFKQVRMGVTTAWGTAARLTALVGRGGAARLLFTGHEIDAVDARTIGLVDEVAEAGTARAMAERWATEIGLGSPTAIAAMKRLVDAGPDAGPAGRTLERSLFIETWSGSDHKEAVAAWFGRRAALFGERSG